MTDTYRAQLTRRPSTGWTLFIVREGLVADWPTTDFHTIGNHPPTVEQRAKALTDMGYGLADAGAGWEWTETQHWEDSPNAPVELTAVAMVVRNPF